MHVKRLTSKQVIWHYVQCHPKMTSSATNMLLFVGIWDAEALKPTWDDCKPYEDIEVPIKQ